MSLPKKATLWYTFSNILQKGIGFFVVPFYIRCLSATEYGQVMIFLSWREIISIFATLNLFSGVFTKAMVDYDQDRDRYTSCMQGLSSIITLVLFFLYLPARSLWNNILEMDSITVILLFLYFLTSPSVSFWSVRQRVENKYKQMVALTIAKALCVPITCIMLILYTNWRANAMIWGILIVEICFGTWFYVYQFIKGRCFYHRSYWVHALLFNLPLIPHYLSLIILSQVDRILIGNICGKDKSGIYSLACQITSLMNVIISAINGALVPWLYQKYKTKEYSIVKDVTNRLCVIMGLITFILMLIAPDIVSIIGTKEYTNAIWLIPPIALGMYFTFCYGFFASVSFYYSATKYVMIATTSGACLSILLNLIFLPKFGFLSAGYTSLLCYFFFLLMHYMYMTKVCKNNTNGDKIFDVRFIKINCLILLGVMLLVLFLYCFSFLVRYLFLFISFILLLKKRNVLSTISIIKI